MNKYVKWGLVAAGVYMGYEMFLNPKAQAQPAPNTNPNLNPTPSVDPPADHPSSQEAKIAFLEYTFDKNVPIYLGRTFIDSPARWAAYFGINREQWIAKYKDWSMKYA
jgi:hypothetical protein